MKGVFGKIRYAQTVNVHRFFTTIFFWIILLNTTRRMGCLWISVPMNTAFPSLLGFTACNAITAVGYIKLKPLGTGKDLSFGAENISVLSPDQIF